MIRALGGTIAAVAATILLLAAFLLPFVLLGLAGKQWLSATDARRGYSLTLPVVTALYHIALVIGVALLANRKRRP